MLQINDLTYGYDAMSNVVKNFTIGFSEPGVYGLLGKNGTGKSTLLYLIMGLLHPSNGEVLFCGMNTKDRNPEALKEMFLVPEEYDLPKISLSAYVKALAPFYPNFDKNLLVELLEVFDMVNINNARKDENGIPEVNLGALSMGQKKKIYMCVALATCTKLLVMDEPTNGLDIPSKSQFRKVMAKGMRNEQIIIVSTHQVRDVEQLLDHVTIIDHNKVLVNKAINLDEPLDLEEMFIKAVTGEE